MSDNFHPPPVVKGFVAHAEVWSLLARAVRGSLEVDKIRSLKLGGEMRPTMTDIERLLERIAAQNETIIEQNTRILTLLALRAVENLPKTEIGSKPKSN